MKRGIADPSRWASGDQVNSFSLAQFGGKENRFRLRGVLRSRSHRGARNRPTQSYTTERTRLFPSRKKKGKPAIFMGLPVGWRRRVGIDSTPSAISTFFGRSETVRFAVTVSVTVTPEFKHPSRTVTRPPV